MPDDIGPRTVRITERAYAKINIGLRILEKRPDQYHNIETVFHRIDLSDTLTFEPAPTISLRCNDPSLPTGRDNLCVSAAQLLLETFPALPIQGVSIDLNKVIPAGAGLGGGSSDAAATLRGICRLSGMNIPPDGLAGLALRIGSDVPYFLETGTAHATGRGESLSYFPLTLPYWIVMINPGIHIPTAWAYAQLHRPHFAPQSGELPLDQLVRGLADDPLRYGDGIRNDFEGPVFAAHPAIGALKQHILSSGAVFAQLSGSGSSVYGFFREKAEATACINMVSGNCRTSLTEPGFVPSAG